MADVIAPIIVVETIETNSADTPVFEVVKIKTVVITDPEEEEEE